jgi:hypothetical protein
MVWLEPDQWRIMAWSAAVLAAAALSPDRVAAQQEASTNDTEVSKETENPVTRRITLPLRYEAEFQNGAEKATKDTFEISQAVAPFRLNQDWALITRTKLPLVVQPPKKRGEHWTTGLGNGYTTFFLSPEQGSGFYWGAGPLLYYPSATDSRVGVHRWGTGPSVAFLRKDESPFVFGAVVNNIWTPGGPPGSSNRTNSFLLNPFASYHFDDGWAISTSPNIAGNWISSDGKWTVPVGGGFNKVVRLGDQPLKLALDGYYNAVRPKAGNDTWLMQFTMTFQFPK